ncbi:NTP transferase domain-containing protein [Halorientalis pallida]|uniref:Sugar nucleotidyltransferase n=1 Tax=Halorientalis pallida TaxID=2479928 RepID=A0A498L157_9EURY|nr:NTP transferase domain-containing protein [Halorientalis pallida]RXK51706.1 sugar nucleotidyltransferase [Halorientalis pallida]
MHAVILAAGEGSRMGGATADVPKAFMDLAGRTLYERQRAAIDPHTQAVTVVLGHAYENVQDQVGDARTVVLEDWDDYENAESLRRGLRGVDDDVLVVNGDVVVTEGVVARLRARHAASDGCNVVACLPGRQAEATAIRCDDRGRVTDYGLITGRRHAGVGVLDRSSLDAARNWLAAHRREWYPGLYTAIETEAVAIPAAHHIEINYPRDRIAARGKLPLNPTDELDVGT